MVARAVSMSFSVHSMAGVNSALQHLQDLSRDKLVAETRIATGLKVGSAKDNGTVWAMAQGMRAANNGRVAAMRSIDYATGVVEVALAAADIMTEMKSKLIAATDAGLDESSWRTLMSEYSMLGNEITRLTESAEFDGKNLLEAGATDLSVLVNSNPTQTITVGAEDMTDGNGILDVALTGTLPYADDSVVVAQPDSTMVTTFENSMDAVNAAVSRLGVSLKTLEIQKTLLTKTMDVTEAGIGNLVDADLGRESAKLAAYRVREQLGQQAVEIANQAPRMVLGFFR